MTFTCKRCGTCCTNYIKLFATKDDIYRWKKKGRDDILNRVRIRYDHTGAIIAGDIWFNPRMGEKIIKRCPFLRKIRKTDKYACLIYETRPEICKRYPETSHNSICLRVHKEEFLRSWWK
jgi:Fe-S-cluster containining protein